MLDITWNAMLCEIKVRDVVLDIHDIILYNYKYTLLCKIKLGDK